MSNFSKSEKEIFELRKQKISFFNELSSNSFPTSFEGTVDIENIIADYVLRYIMKCGNMAKISIPIDILQVVSQYLSMVNFFVRT